MKKLKTVKPRKNEENVSAKSNTLDTATESATVNATDTTAKRKRKFPFLTVIAVVLVCVAILAWALPHLPQKPQTESPATYQGVLELWNVETFEGGVGSREAWLTNKSAKFESANTGLFVHVTTLSVEQLAAKLSEGQKFDLICFSRGVGNLVKDQLAPITENMGFVKQNFLISGQIDGKQYAVPLYSGVYCLFARAEQLPQDQLLNKALTQTYTRKIGKNAVELQPMICGFTPYNSPLSALAMSGGQGKANVSEDVTQYQAYEQFVANRTAVTLLGTQRDMYRLAQRESNGKIEQLSFAPLGAYTDLVQYVGVSMDAGDKADSCVKYVQYLLSEQTQSTLTNLSLFSVLEQSIYTTERYAACEQALLTAYVPNVFADESSIANQRQTAKDTLRM